MKVVGLLSGGKDSCFNLLHCRLNGHEIIALATLSPPDGKEEIDSYLYQTVGQDGIAYIAQALELPLFRRHISGQPVDQRLQYEGMVHGDETEDLFELLKDVLGRYPDIDGVAVGAILSTYQRVRVEHICGRLSLTSLAYLWQRDQFELLHEMKEVGMDSRLIKVAGAGLTKTHLGQNVTSDGILQDLIKLHGRFGLHPCGEGGEYETFTVDCPHFKHRIEILETESVELSDPDADKYSMVAYLRIKSAGLRPKRTGPATAAVVAPPMLDADACRALTVALQAAAHPPRSHPNARLEFATIHSSSRLATRPMVIRAGDWLACTGMHGREGSRNGSSLAEEVRLMFKALENSIASHAGFGFDHFAHINLYLSDMSHFAEVNAEYVKWFSRGNPPTRATVAVPLPDGMRVCLDVLARRAPKTALHVQSLSYWAPANIGPYSQSVSMGDRHFVAGQIGLVPASLVLEEHLARQVTLAAQHVRRIQAAIISETTMDTCICWVDETRWSATLTVSRALWQSWGCKCPIIFVGARQLPRGAAVEWQCTFADEKAATTMRILTDSNEWPSAAAGRPLFARIFTRAGGRVKPDALTRDVAIFEVHVSKLATMMSDDLDHAYVVLSV